MARVRPGFLVTFSVLLLLVMGGVGYLVSHMMSSDIRAEQISAARERTQLLAESAFAPALRRKLHGRTANELSHFDEAALPAERTGDIGSLAVWDKQGQDRLRDRPPPDRPPVPPAGRGHRGAGRQDGVGAPAAPDQPDRQDRRRADPGRGPALRQGPQAPGGLRDPRARTRRSPRRSPAARAASTSSCSAPRCCSWPRIWPRLLAASRALKRENDPKKRLLLAELRKGDRRRADRAALPAEGRPAHGRRPVGRGASSAGTTPSRAG